MTKHPNLAEQPVGVVGLGLMGSSIAAALLIAGHPVRAIAPIAADMQTARPRIVSQLQQCSEAGLTALPTRHYLDNLIISDTYQVLHDCTVVIECVVEKVAIKAQVYAQITEVTHESTIIGSNTSAIPISVLQQYVVHPGRFLGIHWSEPAFMTRFLEVTCGTHTAPEHAEKIVALAHYWGKEPTLLKKDIRGFITNRLMYAVYREIFHLIETGAASREAVDKAFRYDPGSWMTLMGIFRRLDYMGLRDQAVIAEKLFPLLNNTTEVPETMVAIVENLARGVHNEKGLYAYEEGEGSRWEQAFAAFNGEIHNLAAAYSAETVKAYVQRTDAV